MKELKKLGETEARAKITEAAKLAEEGKYRCDGCKKIDDVLQGLLICWGGQVLLGLCADCAERAPMIIRRVSNGIEVRIAETGDLILASSMDQVPGLVHKKTLAKFQKIPL